MQQAVNYNECDDTVQQTVTRAADDTVNRKRAEF